MPIIKNWKFIQNIQIKPSANRMCMERNKMDSLEEKWKKILKKTWENPNFLKKLKENPKKTLQEEGIHIHDDKKINIIEDNHQQINLVIPEKHSEEINDTDLIRISGGFSNSKKINTNSKHSVNRWEIEQMIVIQAIKDPEFKKKLLKDPKKTITDFLKTEPKLNLEKVNVKIEQEKKDEWIIALPAFEHSGLLSEQDLKDLSGGTFAFMTGLMFTQQVEVHLNRINW